MKADNSRRSFLASGLALPLARSASVASSAAPAVNYRVLGKTGLKVSTVGFGCMITSDPSVISRALDLGINHFDTSRDYQDGNNERMVGAALGNRRKSIVLSTKTDGLDTQAALKELDTSLKELKTDYLDIWYLHDKGKASDLTDGLYEAQQRAKKAGKIRFAGVSTHGGHAEVIPAAVKSGRFDVILTSYNFAMDKQMEGLVQSAQSAGVGVVAMKVIAGSFPLPGISSQARALVKRPGAALAALKWVLRNPNVATTIPSMTDADQLTENAKAMGAPFGPADQKLLALQLDLIRPLYCRMCGACEGRCPKGVPVADALRCLMYAEGYGQFPLARARFQGLSRGAATSDCHLCPSCAVQCPNGVRVQQRLIRAQELLA